MAMYLISFTWWDKEYARQMYDSNTVEMDFADNEAWEIDMFLRNEMSGEAKDKEGKILCVSKLF